MRSCEFTLVNNPSAWAVVGYIRNMVTRIRYTTRFGGHTFPHDFQSAKHALAYLRQRYGWSIEHSRGQVWESFRDSVGPGYESRVMCEIIETEEGSV